MTWDAVAALASIVSVVVLAVASTAAVIQLKHVRLANQLQSYARYTDRVQSPEILEARAYLATQDFSEPAVLERAISHNTADHRIVVIGGHFQAVSRLLNMGVLDEMMFAQFISMLPEVWSKLRPVAYALRQRDGVPRWMDVEYLAYRSSKDKTLLRVKGMYDKEFLANTNLDTLIDRNQQQLNELVR